MGMKLNVTKTEIDVRNIQNSFKAKGYVNMKTSVGDLKLEIYHDATLKACNAFFTFSEASIFDNMKLCLRIKNNISLDCKIYGKDTIIGPIFEPLEYKCDRNFNQNVKNNLDTISFGYNIYESKFCILRKKFTENNDKICWLGQVVGGLETFKLIEKEYMTLKDYVSSEILVYEIEVLSDGFEDEKIRNKEKTTKSCTKNVQISQLIHRSRRDTAYDEIQEVTQS